MRGLFPWIYSCIVQFWAIRATRSATYADVREIKQETAYLIMITSLLFSVAQKLLLPKLPISKKIILTLSVPVWQLVVPLLLWSLSIWLLVVVDRSWAAIVRSLWEWWRSPCSFDRSAGFRCSTGQRWHCQLTKSVGRGSRWFWWESTKIKKHFVFLNDLLCQTGADKLGCQFVLEHSVVNYKLYSVIARRRFQLKLIFSHKTSMQLLIWNVTCLPNLPGIGIEGRRFPLLKRRDSSQPFF